MHGTTLADVMQSHNAGRTWGMLVGDGRPFGARRWVQRTRLAGDAERRGRPPCYGRAYYAIERRRQTT